MSFSAQQQSAAIRGLDHWDVLGLCALADPFLASWIMIFQIMNYGTKPI